MSEQLSEAEGVHRKVECISFLPLRLNELNGKMFFSCNKAFGMLIYYAIHLPRLPIAINIPNLI